MRRETTLNRNNQENKFFGEFQNNLLNPNVGSRISHSLRCSTSSPLEKELQQQKLKRKQAVNYGTFSMLDHVIRIELETFTRRKVLKMPEMSETMQKVLDEVEAENMPVWMKKAKTRHENGKSKESEDEDDEDDDERFELSMGVKRRNERCYSDTTIKLLHRKTELSKSIQYTSPIKKVTSFRNSSLKLHIDSKNTFSRTISSVL